MNQSTSSQKVPSLSYPYTNKTHPTLHNCHFDKNILSKIINKLQQQNQPMSLYKVRAHANNSRNDMTNALAKRKKELRYYHPGCPHEFSHSSPYYLHKDK
jgi:hypothetical protein